MVRSLCIASVVLLVAFATAEDKKKYAKDMSNQNLDMKKFDKTKDYSNWNFENSSLQLCETMRDCIFTGSNFSGCKLWGSSMDGAKMNDCLFIDADFSKAGIQKADFTGSDLRKANINCSTQNTNFSKADLRDTKGFVDITGTNFNGAKLAGADFSEAKVFATKPTMKGATYSKLTRWPQGFDPEEHGAKLEEEKKD